MVGGGYEDGAGGGGGIRGVNPATGDVELGIAWGDIGEY